MAARSTNKNYGPSSAAMLADGYEKGDFDHTKSTSGQPTDDDDWLQMCKDAWYTSRTWFDASIRRQMQDNNNAFNSKHPSGSKYYSDAYIKRSSLFRPRTRSSMRKLEAACTTAFFSTNDVVVCEAVDKSNKDQVRAAKIKSALLKYRLNSKGSIPWFVICQGAFQQAAVEGTVISKQSWRFERDSDGDITIDRGDIRLIPNENFRVDPACDWSDPIGTSPYLIELVPYHIFEIKRRTNGSIDDKTGAPAWRKIPQELINSTLKHQWDSIRQAREDNRIDRYQSENAISDYEIVWVHHYIMKMVDGKDYVFDTLGTEILLSDPIPLKEYYPLGFRPYVMGNTIVEAHKIYNASPTQLGLPLQIEINETANAHLDNTKLETNKRYFVKRGASTDIHSLMRNTPGSIVYTTDPKTDIQEITPPAISRNMFEERDRLNAEYDDTLGVFQGSSAGVNRELTNTVGGAHLLSETAAPVSELTIRTFGETWARPALQQLMMFEEAYEDDMRVLNLIGAQFGQDGLGVISALGSDTEVRVSVGFGATNPAKRMERVKLAASITMELMPEAMAKMDIAEMIGEIWGAAGFPDASRFFPFMSDQEQDPQMVQAQEKIQELEQALETASYEWEYKLKIEQVKGEFKLQLEQIKGASVQQMQQATQKFDAWIAQQKFRLEEMNWKIKHSKSEIDERSMRLQREALSHSISSAERLFNFEIFKWQREQQQSEAESPAIISNVVDIGIPADSRSLMSSLRSPPSGEPIDLPGADKAGTLARSNYGNIPFAGG